MTIRLKILAIACALLLVFAVTAALSALLIRGVIDEMGGIVDYHIKLTTFASEVDVIAFEYELNLRRLLERGTVDPEKLTAVAQRQREITDRVNQNFKEATVLLAKAVQDERNDLSDRIRLARIDGTVQILARQVPPFLSLGASVLKAIEEGRIAEARRLIQGFSAFEEAFGPDIAGVRQALEELTKDSILETEGQEVRVLWINALLFVGAAIVGFGLFAVLTHRLQQAFRRLLEGTHSVEAGQFAVELAVTSQDEIGQLTKAFNKMLGELRSKEQIKDTFGKFLDPRIVANLLGAAAKNGEAAERRAVTVFFSDIKGFSSLSEQLTADVMVKLLNGYFTAVTKIIRDHNGIVDKYIGDSVMAFWSPPFSQGDQHAAEACLAALAQQAAIVEFRRRLSDIIGLRRNVPEFKVRMGLATGEVIIGTIGSENTKSYTVIGDIVNVASRLEGVNKVFGTQIIVSEDTLRLAHHAVEARELDLLTVVGKTEPIRVFELLARAGELAPQLSELRGLFAEGLAAYRQENWDGAEMKFRECLRLQPEDGPARTFLDRVAVLRQNPPAPGWDGVWWLESK